MSAEEEKKKAQTKAAAVEIEVSFREIDAIYDLTNGRRLVSTPKGPRLVYPNTFRFYSYAGRGDPQFEDEAGERVREVKGIEPGVYQAIRITGYAPALRTFMRKAAAKVDDKWIYIFESDSKSGDNMKLHAELYAKGGELQHVDLVANAEKNERKPAGAKRKNVVLTVRSIARPNGVSYFMLLAPYQIPWSSLVKMQKSGNKLASRCMRLFDEFYTDATAGGDPQTMWELEDERKEGKALGFMMYLVDPFKEGLRRAQEYATYVTMWQFLQSNLGKDPEYVLAKRIHNLPQRYVDVVWHKLGPYLWEKEQDVRKWLRVATMRLEDLMCWIGENHQRSNWSIDAKVNNKASVISSDTWWFSDKGAGVSTESKADRAWYNSFSELVGDYHNDDTPKEIYEKVGEVVAAVHARLNDLPRGQDFLAKIVNDAFRGDLPTADAGAKLLFEAVRKGNNTAADAVGALLEHYVPHWVKAYRSDALPQLVKFMREKHKIELRQIKPSRVRKIEEKLARKAHEKAAKKGIERLAKHYHLEVDPASARAVGMTSKGLNRLAFGIEVFNMKLSLSEFAQETDFWSGLGLLGSTLDAYDVASKIFPKLESHAFAYSFGGARKVIKIAPILVIISSAIDTIMAGRDTINSTNFGMGAGHAIRTLGAGMTVGGALAAKTGVGIVVALIGLGLQAAGSWIASEFDDIQQFLRHSKWGDASNLDSISNWFSDSNNFGYSGDLDDLRNDINAQLRALDWMFFVFKPELGQFNGKPYYVPSRITLKMNPPKAINGAAVWTVKLDVIDRDNGMKLKTYEWRAADELDHAELSANEEIAIFLKENFPPSNQPTISAGPVGKVKVKGEIKLDVFGDGSSYVVRKIDKNLDLPW